MEDTAHRIAVSQDLAGDVKLQTREMNYSEQTILHLLLNNYSIIYCGSVSILRRSVLFIIMRRSLVSPISQQKPSVTSGQVDT